MFIGCNGRKHFKSSSLTEFGMDGNTIEYGALDGKVVLIVCTDIAVEFGSRSGTRFVPEYDEFFSYRKSPENQIVEWSCKTKDGRNGIVTINNREYNLANGILFFVKNKEGGEVAQHEIDTDNLMATRESVVSLFVNNYDLSQIFNVK